MSSTDGTAGTDGTNIQMTPFIRFIIQLDKMMPAPQLMLREQLVNMWSDFEKLKPTHFTLGQIQKFHVFMLPLSLVAGSQKIWTVTLK